MLPSVHALVLIAAVKFSLQLETGPEYDSNAPRAERLDDGSYSPQVGPPTGSPLWRATANALLAWRHGPNVLRLTGTLGGKAFFLPEVLDQNALVGQLTLDDKIQLKPKFWLCVAADYYDVGQLDAHGPIGTNSTVRHRDFRSGSASLALAFDVQGSHLSLDGGFRGVEYKPDDRYNFNGGFGHATLFRRFSLGDPEQPHEIDLFTGYRIEHRFFRGEAQKDNCSPGASGMCDLPIVGSGTARSDWFQESSFEVTYVRSFLLSLGYTLTLDLSNSFGESLVRHTVASKVGVRLPWQLYATAKIQFLFTHFLNAQKFPALAEQTFISLDEENRNSLVVELERAVWRRDLFVKVRYSLYTNELTSAPVDFQRHVIFLGIRYKWEITR